MSVDATYHRAEIVLSDIVETLDRADIVEDSREVVPLGHGGAAAVVWIAGRRYSLSLIHEDD